MMDPESSQQILIKTNLFRVCLGVGIVSFIIAIYVNTSSFMQQHQCWQDHFQNICENRYFSDMYLCHFNSQYYCCEDHQNYEYDCPNDLSNCHRSSYRNRERCENYSGISTVFYVISLCSFAGLIILYCLHQKKKNQQTQTLMMDNSYGAENNRNIEMNPINGNNRQENLL